MKEDFNRASQPVSSPSGHRRPWLHALKCTRSQPAEHFFTDQFQDQFLCLCGAVWGGVVRGGGKCDRKGCCGSQCVYFNESLLAFRQHGM